MNIQNLPLQKNNADANKQVITQQQDKQPAIQQDGQTLTKPSELSLPNQDNISELLKQLTDKIALSQKVIDNMPDAIKAQIREMLSQNATLQNLTNGLSDLLQGQKEIFKELSNISDVLNDIAKLIAQAEQNQEQVTLPKLLNLTDQEKELFLQKQNLQLLQQLLDNIGDPKMQELLKKIIEANIKLPEKQPEIQQDPQTNKLQQQIQESAKPNQTQPQEQQLKELIKTLIDQQNTIAKQAVPKEQVQAKLQPENPVQAETTKPQTEQKPANQQVASDKQEQPSQPKNNQIAKELENITNKDILKEIVTKLKTINQTMDKSIKQPEQDTQQTQQTIRDGVKQELANATKPQQQITQNIDTNQPQPKENTLLDAARQNLPTDKQNPQEPLKPQDILKLVKNLQTVTASLDQLGAKDEQLFKALQTLSKNFEMLSTEQKEILKNAITQTIKQTFKDGGELSTLQKALNSTIGKDNTFLDQQTKDLKNFDKLLKTYESLQFSSKQVQQWSTALRDLASDMLKTTNMPTEKTMQHMQTSFVFNMAPEGQEKPSPVYINIYHEKGKNNGEAYEKMPETWLKINVSPEYVGEVTAIFHLYQENLLDVKVIFKNPEGMNEFARFIPDIQGSLTNSNMQLNSILVV